MESSYNNPYNPHSLWGRVKIGWKPTDALPKSKHGFPIMPIGGGEYTPHYSRLKHGPYYHMRYYGDRPKMSLWNTRIADLEKWWARADKTPRGMKDWYTRWQANLCYRTTSFKAPYFTRVRLFLFAGMILGYMNKYRYIRWDRHYKYH